jgi:hypothetical protein
LSFTDSQAKQPAKGGRAVRFGYDRLLQNAPEVASNASICGNPPRTSSRILQFPIFWDFFWDRAGFDTLTIRKRHVQKEIRC